MEKLDLTPKIEQTKTLTNRIGGPEGEEYKVYSDRIYNLVVISMREKGILGKVQRKKLLAINAYPPRQYLFLIN